MSTRGEGDAAHRVQGHLADRAAALGDHLSEVSDGRRVVQQAVEAGHVQHRMAFALLDGQSRLEVFAEFCELAEALVDEGCRVQRGRQRREARRPAGV